MHDAQPMHEEIAAGIDPDETLTEQEDTEPFADKYLKSNIENASDTELGISALSSFDNKETHTSASANG